MIGKTISHYKILDKLGEGGMGEVYLAQDTELDRKVALKFLPPHCTTDPEIKARFKREAKAAAALNHPNIITIYEVGEHEDKAYIAMEYVAGESLKELISKKALFTNKAIEIASQVCEGLREADHVGIVHRDIKPENILIDSKGRVKIADFGLAKMKGTSKLTKESTTLGTLYYMSPEQFQNEEADKRTDIWSLGVVLYEMITGCLPFHGDYESAVMYSVMNEDPEPLARFKANVSEQLQAIVTKTLAKTPDERYQHADEILVDLKSVSKELESGKTKTGVTKPKLARKEQIFLYGGAVILLFVLIVGAFFLFTGHEEAIDSIAVLPLENLSGDPQQEYFADGMTDALITELSKIGALRVISRTSAMRYKGTEKLLPEIARDLGVDVLVEGSVLHAEDKVRIMVQLIKATPEKHLWAYDYERDLRNIITLQKEVAQAIAREIKITVRPEEQARLTQSRPINPEAYQLYLKGRFFSNKRTEEDLKKAIDYFKETIGLDPNHALGYIGLADSYLMLDAYTEPTLKEAYLKAREAVLKALEIDSNLAEARTSLAWIKMEYDWDWGGAEREFKRAIELNPGYATAHRWYSRYLMYMARFDEAIEEIKHALELDPLSLVNNSAVGSVLYYARQYDRAIEALRKTIEMDPNFSNNHLYLGKVYLQKSMYEEALTEFQKEKELSRSLSSILESWIGITYLQMGKRSEAQDVLDDLIERKKKQGNIRTIIAAFFYFALGKHDQGFEALEKEIKEREIGPWRLKISPVYDSVRSDPRFIALLNKVGLE
jgi:serine/threonine protein kinase/tetratricopeptide (TPR) repeat protein